VEQYLITTDPESPTFCYDDIRDLPDERGRPASSVSHRLKKDYSKIIDGLNGRVVAFLGRSLRPGDLDRRMELIPAALNLQTRPGSGAGSTSAGPKIPRHSARQSLR